MRLSPGARLTDGQFNVNVIRGMSRWRALGYFRRLLRGTHTRLPGVHYFTATSLRVSGVQPVVLQVDGELFGHTPATFRIRPGGLRLLQQR
jgi:diacylglycerol kinase family enzyme